MKILITVLVISGMCMSSAALAFDWNVPWKKDKQTKIEKDKSGGYSETQRDYKARKKRTQKDKEGAGYYGGEYHNTSQDYTKGEWQFVEEDK